MRVITSTVVGGKVEVPEARKGAAFSSAPFDLAAMPIKHGSDARHLPGHIEPDLFPFFPWLSWLGAP
jgi:hypothetical protein